MRSRRSRLLLPVVFVGFAAAICSAMLGSTAGASVASAPRPPTDNDEASAPRVISKADRRVIRRIINHRNSTWRWQTVMFKPRTPYDGAAETTQSDSYRRWVLRVWENRAKVAWRKAQRPPHYDEWHVHPPLRGQLGRPQRAVLRRSPDGHELPARVRLEPPPDEGARPTTGRRSSRCGWPSGHMRPDAGSTRGRTPRVIAISSDAAALAADDLDEPAAVALAVELEEQHALPLAEQ